MPDGNPRKLLDSSKLFKLGWKPSISIDEGLKDTYKWFLANSKSKKKNVLKLGVIILYQLITFLA